MKKFLLLMAISFLPSLMYAQSQGEMNRTSLKDFEAVDKRLNVIYEQIISGLDEKGKEKLRASERAWLAYRDAQAAFEADVVAREGTMSPLIYNEARVALTEARIKELQKSVAVK